VIADAKYNPLQVFELLLNTAQFELKIRDMFKHVSDIILTCLWQEDRLHLLYLSGLIVGAHDMCDTCGLLACSSSISDREQFDVRLLS
jgi:hypothetical protein